MRQKSNAARHPPPDTEAALFYSEVLRILAHASIAVLVGGGYALEFYTPIGRYMKDLDLFIKREDLDKVLAALHRNGFRTTLDFPHWLGKVYDADRFIDIIFSSGNGLCAVDSLWFEHSHSGTLFGLPVRLCPPEEMIWSKAFIMERERYDGADIAHLLRKCGKRLDWDRLLWRFGPHWRVLFSHLILFDYIYPSERQCVSEEIRTKLIDRLKDEMIAPGPEGQFCRGSLLSRNQYQIDTVKLGYTDARIAPEGKLSAEEAISWTAAANPPDKH